MLQAMHIARFRTTGRFLLFAFLVTIALFGLSNTIAFVEMRSAQATYRGVVQNAMRSVELVSRYVHDVDQKRLLVDAHIFGGNPVDYIRIERVMAEVDADMASVARDYAPLATFDGERAVWARLQEEVAGTRGPLERAIALSRRNQDSEARAVMTSVESSYAAIDRDAALLIEINHQESERNVDRLRRLQHRSLLFLGGVTVAGMSVAFFIAAWVTRLMTQRDVALRHSAERLEARNRELDAFAGRVAHDLRGPLTTISLSGDQLAKRAGAGDGTTAVLRRGVARMEALIRDLLALSRIEAQQADSHAPLHEIAASVAQDLAAELSEVGADMRLDVHAAEVGCSEALLRQAVWNLCENAVKYRRPDAPLLIELSGRTVGRRYSLRVIDNGAGMPAHEAHHVFEPFFRGQHVRETPGTGLGLSIVKRVVESCNGAISVESVLGRGTTFTINLPLAGSRSDASAPRA